MLSLRAHSVWSSKALVDSSQPQPSRTLGRCAGAAPGTRERGLLATWHLPAL